MCLLLKNYFPVREKALLTYLRFRCFFIQTHDWWARFIYLSIVFLAILIFFEPPSSAAITVCDQEMFKFKKGSEICNNKSIIKDWEAWTLFVEFLLIMVSVVAQWYQYALIFCGMPAARCSYSLNVPPVLRHNIVNYTPHLEFRLMTIDQALFRKNKELRCECLVDVNLLLN